MAIISKNKELVWKEADILADKDPNMWRIDPCGACINWREFNKKTKYGWNVDHILPQAKGGTYHIFNLCAMHWKNNMNKADNFPRFKTAISFNGTENVECIEEREWDISVLERLKQVHIKNKYVNV